MHEYQHTQPATLMRVIFGGGAVISGLIVLWTTMYAPNTAFIPSLFAVILLACLFLFHSLTVRVTGNEILIRFGIGLIGKRISMYDVERAAVVKNRWFYGWGVRLTPHGWLYNVSGFDAVEIQLTNGRKYRVGTDEPAQLRQAIEDAATGTGTRNVKPQRL